MRADSNTYDKQGELWFDGIRMRSRFEAQTASVLKSLGLEFKYEPALPITGGVICPDFVVYLPEFEVGFVIECLGGVGDGRYDRRNGDKGTEYLDNFYIPFRDVLLLGGTGTYMPSEDWIANAVIMMVNSIAGECVIKETQLARAAKAIKKLEASGLGWYYTFEKCE